VAERELNTIRGKLIAGAIELAERVGARPAERASKLHPPADQKVLDKFNDLSLKRKNSMKGSSTVVTGGAAKISYTEKGEFSTSAAPRVEHQQKLPVDNEYEKPRSEVVIRPPSPHKRQCAACMENYLNCYLMKLFCWQEYCNGCLTTMFQGAAAEESSYLPQCYLQDIRLELVLELLNHEVVRDYLEKNLNGIRKTGHIATTINALHAYIRITLNGRRRNAQNAAAKLVRSAKRTHIARMHRVPRMRLNKR
jgi:hypothetical protein